MISALVLAEATGCQFGLGYRPAPAIYRRAPIECRPLPVIGAVGTGGLENAGYYRFRMGYQPFPVVEFVTQPEQAPFAELMREVKTSFGRTMTRLPEVFGVSRQTLYNWLDGDVPKPPQQAKLTQLAEAARVFAEFGFKPTSQALDRTVTEGKSFLELLSDGASGRDTAKKLVRISQRGVESRTKLTELLGGRKARPELSDIGTNSLRESA